MPCPQLPCELLDLILPNLLSPAAPSSDPFSNQSTFEGASYSSTVTLFHHDSATLSSLCLVSKLFRSYAQPFLFRRVKLVRSIEQIEAFQRILRRDVQRCAELSIEGEGRRSLGDHVEELWIGIPERAQLGSDQDRGVMEVFDFDLVPRLESLRVERIGVGIDSLGSGKLASLQSLSLSHLHLYDPLDQVRSSGSPPPSSSLRTNSSLKNLQLGHFFYGRHHLAPFLASLSGLHHFSIVETLVMEPDNYFQVFTGFLTRTQNRTYPVEVSQEAAVGPPTGEASFRRGERMPIEDTTARPRARESDSMEHSPFLPRKTGLTSLSLTFSPKWQPNSEVARQAGLWLLLLPLCPPSLTQLTLSLLTATPWIELFNRSLPASIETLILIIDPEAECHSMPLERGRTDLGLQVSRMILSELKRGSNRHSNDDDDSTGPLRSSGGFSGLLRFGMKNRQGGNELGLLSSSLKQAFKTRGIELIS